VNAGVTTFFGGTYSFLQILKSEKGKRVFLYKKVLLKNPAREAAVQVERNKH